MPPRGNYLSSKNPAPSSAAASTKARILQGRIKDRNIPAPKHRASSPTAFFSLQDFGMTFSSRADGAADGAPSAIPLCFKYMLLFSFRDLTRGFSYPAQAAVFRTGAIFRI